MSSPWKNNQPEVVADRVLRRAEVSKMARKLQNRLALAQFKAKHGWEDLTLDLIEPKVDEHLRRQRPSSAGDMLSDTSSSSASDFDFAYPRTVLSSSPLKAPFFSDALDSSSGSSGHRKRSYNASFHNPASSHSTARKRFRSSPSAGRSISQGHTSWKDQHQLSQSSPIKPRKQPHFTTSAGPNLSFFRGVSGTIAEDLPSSAHPSLDSNSDSDSDLLPLHSFKLPTNNNISRSSPPRTPPPRHRAITRRSTAINNNTTLTTHASTRKSNIGEEGADLLLYLATSPSPAHPRSNSRMHPPQTPPSKPLALPSSMMTTPGGGMGLLSAFGGGGGPHTPSQTFDFADFVNITPSPAQGAFKTPASVARRAGREGFMPTSSPMLGGVRGGGRGMGGLGMELGGELLS